MPRRAAPSSLQRSHSPAKHSTPPFAALMPFVIAARRHDASMALERVAEQGFSARPSARLQVQVVASVTGFERTECRLLAHRRRILWRATWVRYLGCTGQSGAPAATPA
jgi:hypothetical protein